MFVQEKLYTIEEYWEITQLPENENKRLELVHGVIVELASSSKQNTITAARFVFYLSGYVLEHDLGYVTGADGGFTLGTDHVRLPDAAFISRERAGGMEGNTFPTAPDLAVEVISGSESARRVTDKARAYLEAGAKLVWAAYPEEKVVDIYRLNDAGEMIVETVYADGVLEGSSVLPEFRLPVKQVFPE